MTAPIGVHLGRSGVIVFATFAIGLPVFVVIIMVGNGRIWPFVPILIGGWVIVVLLVRAVARNKIYMSTFRNSEKSSVRKSAASRRGSTMSNASPETRIKYAHRIVKGVSETRALHYWHPVLLAEMDVHPRRARASKGKG